MAKKVTRKSGSRGGKSLISGVHAIVYAEKSGETRRFYRDVLGLKFVDAGHGWLVFALPPAELGVHPQDGEGGESGRHVLYLMCDDITKTVAGLKAKGVEFVGDIRKQAWGLLTTLKVPGGGEMGLYQPRHPTALGKRR